MSPQVLLAREPQRVLFPEMQGLRQALRLKWEEQWGKRKKEDVSVFLKNSHDIRTFDCKTAQDASQMKYSDMWHNGWALAT